MLGGQRAIRHDMTALLRVGGAENRAAHFHGHVMGRLDHAERAAMAGATLDHIDRRVRESVFSISAAFGPIFWARAWQARCTVTPSGNGDRPSGKPVFLGHVDHIFVDVEDVVGDAVSRLHCPGTISAHSNFSIRPQEAVSATMS